MNNETINVAELGVQLSGATPLEQQLAALGEVLGVGAPVSRQVLFGALQDPTYARNLLVSRRSPRHLNYLLSHPPAVEIPEPDAQMPANRELMKNAASALVRWASTGFSIADEATLRRREDACLACPHLATPTRFLQKILPSRKETMEIGRRTGDKVCDLCGCSVGRKMRLTAESCPDKAPDQPAFTRWGEPIERTLSA